MASYVLKGRCALRTCGDTIDDTLHIPGAILLPPGDPYGHRAPVKVVDPIAALAVVAYDWNDAGTGGALWGAWPMPTDAARADGFVRRRSK